MKKFFDFNNLSFKAEVIFLELDYLSMSNLKKIIYLIATNYILGFDDILRAEATHFVQADEAEASKNDSLQELVDKYFG